MSMPFSDMTLDIFSTCCMSNAFVPGWADDAIKAPREAKKACAGLVTLFSPLSPLAACLLLPAEALSKGP